MVLYSENETSKSASIAFGWRWRRWRSLKSCRVVEGWEAYFLTLMRRSGKPDPEIYNRETRR